MTFIYLTVFREQKKGSNRCAAVAHLVPTWTTGKYRMDCYANENQVSVAALKTFVNALDLMPFKDDKITVVTNCHEFAWDMGLVLSGHQSEFLPKECWQDFVSKVSDNQMSFLQFRVTESSMMLPSEKAMAQEQIACMDWGFVL